MMQEFQTNYTEKHGTRIPPPKLYMDEGDSEEEGIELNDGTVYGGRAPTDPNPKPPEGTGGAGRGTGRGAGRGTGTGGTGGAGRGAGRGSGAGGSGGGGAGGSGGGSGGSSGGSGSGADSSGDPPGGPSRGRKRGRDDDDDDPEDDPNKKLKPDPPGRKGPKQKEGKPRGGISGKGGKGGKGGKQPRLRNLQYTGPCMAYDETYPPVDNTKPVFYINRTKQSTPLGYTSLPWTDGRSKTEWTFGSSQEVQARDYSTEGETSFPERHSVTHQKVTLPEVGEGDCTRL